MPHGREDPLDFSRRSIADQAADALREAIKQGVWTDSLPGEHALARRLNISRPTLRAALARLARDNLITIRQGQQSKICRGGRSSRREIPPTVCVINLTPSTGLAGHPLLTEMRAQLATQGVGWEEIVDRGLQLTQPGRRLATLVHGRQRACWVLVGCTPAIQRWFQEARVPTVVLGSCHSGVNLPSVDVAYQAIGWHAAGVLARHRHRRVALVATEPLLAGDLACIHGLRSYRPPDGAPLALTILTTGPGRPELADMLDRVLRGPHPVSAVMSMHVAPVLSAYVHLLRAGLRIPGEISLLCRETEPAVELGLPELTRYRNPLIKQVHQSTRLIRSLLAGNQVPEKPCLIMPAFVPGDTVARAAENPR